MYITKCSYVSLDTDYVYTPHCVCAQSCPTLCNPVACSPSGSLSMGFSRQILEWVSLLQGIFLTQGSNPCFLCLLYCQADSLPPVKEYIHITYKYVCTIYTHTHTYPPFALVCNYIIPETE